MSKQKIDKLFSEKLKSHKTPPADKVWEALEKELGETHQSSTGGWWKVAAVILLCLLAGVGIYREMDDDQKLVTKQEAQNQPPLIEQPAQSEQELEVTPEKKEVEPSLPVVPEKNESPQVASNQPVPSAAKAQKTSRSPEPSSSVVAEQPVQSVERLEPVASLSVEEEELVIENEELAEEVTKVMAEVHAPVKIIYKSNAAPQTEETEAEKGSKFFEIVKDIKNGDLGLAELREAKSELLASAFAKLKDKQEKQ